MRTVDIISKKKQGLELSDKEIEFIVKGYTLGEIPDYQMSALAMAICFNGMTEKEVSKLTYEMSKSGDVLDLSEFGDLTVDKHSSGGIGDKTTLIIAPIVSACGCVLAKMSGRGLGYTGGTIDKLEAITGYNTSISNEQFIIEAKDNNIVLSGQTGNLVPFDKKLYSLRDVTATVDSLPLIASSIMSKKLAAGSKNIILDVKCGSGAFMKSLEDAEALSKLMVQIGKNNNRNVVAYITNMDVPLGKTIGNSLEVIEAIKILKGEYIPNIYELSIELASKLVSMAKNISVDEARKLAKESIKNGSAFDKFKLLVKTHGGDVSLLENTNNFKKANYCMDICSKEKGYIYSLDALKLGNISMKLGAGRETKEMDIDYLAGIELNHIVGDVVEKGECLLTIYSSNEDKLKQVIEEVYDAIEISNEIPKTELIYKVIE